jgi:hypothetical protein
MFGKIYFIREEQPNKFIAKDRTLDESSFEMVEKMILSCRSK